MGRSLDMAYGNEHNKYEFVPLSKPHRKGPPSKNIRGVLDKPYQPRMLSFIFVPLARERECALARVPSSVLAGRTARKPMLLFVFDGLFLLRFAERQFLALLFQLPPRFTRFEPVCASLKTTCGA